MANPFKRQDCLSDRSSLRLTDDMPRLKARSQMEYGLLQSSVAS